MASSPPRADGAKAPDDDVAHALLKEDPGEIVDSAADEGRHRLDRTALDIFVTALIGGAEVSLGALGAMTIMGAVLAHGGEAALTTAFALVALAFPIGFLFVVLGGSELFTENFLIPVVSVYNRERTVGSLVGLWALSWLGNFVACVVTALLLMVPGALDESILSAYHAYAEHKLKLPIAGLVASSVLAGAVMTVMTWILLAVREPMAKVAVIFAVGYVLFAANLAHSIVGAAALFVGVGGPGQELGLVLPWLAIATAGNLLGGVVLVTLFRVVQVRERRGHPSLASPPEAGTRGGGDAARGPSLRPRL
jgi:formate/nitrite transporter FocA (FNT family)